MTKPLPFTVMTGIELELPNDPVLLFTVANVNALVPTVLEASPENAGSLAAPSVPLEIFVAFNDVREAPEPLGLSTSVPITKPKLVLAVPASVAPVPPLAIGRVPLMSAVLISKASQEGLVPSVLRYLPALPVCEGV